MSTERVALTDVRGGGSDVRRGVALADVLAAEWIKLRSLRSTYWFLGVTVATLAVSCLVSFLMTADWDSSPPESQKIFGAADAGTLLVPVLQFVAAAFCGLAMTSEYGTGMIRSSLVGVPRRHRLFVAKALVAGGCALALGSAATFAAFLGTELIVGDRPAPIAPWQDPVDGVIAALASSLTVLVSGLVALGLGAVLRSAAGTLVSMTGLLFVAPVVVRLIPAPHGDRLAAVVLSNLQGPLAGTSPDALLSPLGAGLVLSAYVVTAVAAGMYTLARRDA